VKLQDGLGKGGGFGWAANGTLLWGGLFFLEIPTQTVKICTLCLFFPQSESYKTNTVACWTHNFFHLLHDPYIPPTPTPSPLQIPHQIPISQLSGMIHEPQHLSVHKRRHLRTRW
jgi:hypothetical protein